MINTPVLAHLHIHQPPSDSACPEFQVTALNGTCFAKLRPPDDAGQHRIYSRVRRALQHSKNSFATFRILYLRPADLSIEEVVVAQYYLKLMR